MPYLEWNKSLEIGNEIIDAEHIRLMETVNVLHDIMRSGCSLEKLKPFVKSVVDYNIYHMSHEESLFLPTAYPDSDMHIKEHEDVKKRIAAIQEKMNDENKEQVAMEIMTVLKEWMIPHIQTVDIKIASFIKPKNRPV